MLPASYITKESSPIRTLATQIAYEQFLKDLEEAYIAYEYLNFYSNEVCYYEPKLELIHVLTCDCQDPHGRDCYNASINELGRVRGCPFVDNSIVLPRATLEISSEVFPVNAGCQDIQLSGVLAEDYLITTKMVSSQIFLTRKGNNQPFLKGPRKKH